MSSLIGLDLDAEPAAPDSPNSLSCVIDRRHGVGRNGEADADRAAGRRDDGRVHADDLAVHIEQRTAGVAFVDGCIGLQEIIVGAGVDVALLGRDDADGDRAAEAERIADGHDPVADPADRRTSRSSPQQAASSASP